MKRFIVVFDNEPSDPAPWVAKAASAAGLFLVDNDAISTEISKIPEAQKALLESGLPPGERAELAPFYKKALEKVAADKQRIGVYSTSWLLYLGEADGCVLDFSGLEEQRRIGLASGMKQKDVDDYVSKYSKQLEDRARKHLAANRVLVVPAKESDARKAELATDFIKKLG